MKENADKVRALDAAELQKQLRDGEDQMFRLRFQLTLGQTDGLNKLRKLRKERARMLTVQREHELDAAGNGSSAGTAAPPAKTPAKKATAKEATAKKVAAKKASGKSKG